MADLRIIPIPLANDVNPGDDLAALTLAALRHANLALQGGDILVVTHKVVAKAENCLVDLSTVQPSPFAHQLAAQGQKSAAYYEVVLQQSRRIVRMQNGVLITETHHGFVCANAGVDESNMGAGNIVALLPPNPDESAARIRAILHTTTGCELAVILCDSFGRPWREGQVNIAIGVAGMAPLQDYTGQHDNYGRTLQTSTMAVADEIAGAAELVMNKTDRVPLALVRGYPYQRAEGSVQPLLRNPRFDLFR